MPQSSERSVSSVICFGPFQLIAAERLLLRDARAVNLGSRSLEILIALLKRPGEIVSKRELVKRVWGEITVEEGSLRVQIAGLRKALGESTEGTRYLKTVPGRGYSFVGQLSYREGLSPPQAPAPGPATESPPPVEARGDLIGRAGDLDEVLRRQRSHRLLTLVGPGGIGKTTLAFAAARELSAAYSGAVHTVDLAIIADPQLLVPTIASALGLQQSAALPGSPEWLAATLHDRRLLLVLDNCEHVIEPAAALAESLLRLAPSVSLLATSQEPLRAAGEFVYRVPPLATVPLQAEPSAAAELFVARFRAAMPGFEPDERAMATIDAICGRLDGIPLAIELAAARAALMGVDAVVFGLDRRFQLLRGGRRTAHPRHQTMQAALEWSFDLLRPRERDVLCQLSVFAGSFPLAAAEAVVAQTPDLDSLTCIADLVARSLLNAEVSGRETRYRLLETIRLYAQMRLPSEAISILHRRHLRFYTARMAQAVDHWRSFPVSEWLASYGRDLENVGLALRWAFASDDAAERRLGADLSALSMPLWLEASLHAEARLWADRALEIADLETRHEMMLQIARGTILLNTEAGSHTTRVAFQRGLELADLAGDAEHALRALYGLWVEALHANEYEEAYAVAERFRNLAEQSSSRPDIRVGDRLIGTSAHYLGRVAEARMRLDAWLQEPSNAAERPRESRFGFDQNVAALTTLARVLALHGELDRALAVAEQAVQEARSLSRIASYCHALGEQCVIALWIGRLDVLARACPALTVAVDRHGFGFWRPHALVSEAVQAGSAGAPMFGRALDQVGIERFDVVYPSLTGAVALGLKAAGKSEVGRSLVSQALRRPNAMNRWSAPEMLLCAGLLADENDAARRMLSRALEHARTQRSYLLELRTLTALSPQADHDGMLRAALDRIVGGEGSWHIEAARQALGAGEAR